MIRYLLLYHSLTLVCVIVGLGSPAVAAEKPQNVPFTVPKQGHIRLLAAQDMEVHGVRVKTPEDVVRLYDQIEAIPFDEETITSFRLLEQLGLKRIERPLPEPPPGVVGPVKRIPAWRSIVIDFNEERFTQRTKYDVFEEIAAVSPQSVVSISVRPNQTLIYHQLSQLMYSRMHTVGDLFARRTMAPWELPLHVQKLREGPRVFYVDKGETFHNQILSEPGKDVIYATLKGRHRLGGFTLHNYQQPPTKPSGVWVPRLTCHFDGVTSAGKARLSIYIIHEADFENPIDPQRLVVPVDRGDRYYKGYRDVETLELFIKDLPALTPAEVLQLNAAVRNNL